MKEGLPTAGAAAMLMLAVSTAGGVEATVFRLKKTAESVVDPAALVYTKDAWGTCPNGKAFQQDGIASYDGWQYATWWDGERRLCIGRRKLPGTRWETIRFNDYRHRGTDTHNVSVLGICPKDGTIHLAFDHHVQPLHYRVSRRGVATDGDTVKWTAELFGPVTSKLNADGRPLKAVTYPRFLVTPRGGLQLFRRLGTCGDAECVLYEYDPANGRWKTLGAVTSRKGDYHGSRSRYSYLNGADYDAKGRLHLTWCWRESGSPMTNHDICYAYSDDRGRTWLNNAGERVGATGRKPIRVDPPGITVWEIGQRRGLINSTCQAVDSQRRVHVVTWHVPPDGPRAKSWKEAQRRRRYYHYWRGTDGTWYRGPVDPKVVGAGSRPKILFDRQDNLYLVFSVSVAVARAAGGWKDWSVAFAEPGAFLSQPLIDTRRWRDKGVLSIYAQRRGDKRGAPTPLCVVDLKPQ